MQYILIHQLRSCGSTDHVARADGEGGGRRRGHRGQVFAAVEAIFDLLPGARHLWLLRCPWRADTLAR